MTNCSQTIWMWVITYCPFLLSLVHFNLLRLFNVQEKAEKEILSPKEQTYYLDVPFSPRREVCEKAKMDLG